MKLFERYLSHLLLWLALSVPASVMAASYQIGVLAYDGKTQAQKRWQPTADYLSRRIEQARFQIVPLTHEEFEHAINKGELDFVLTNPGHYVRLEVMFGITRIATFLNQYQQQTLNQFSSVLFGLKSSGPTSIKQLKGKTLAAVKEGAFGGFQLVQDMLNQQGFDVTEEMDIKWLGFPHSDVVRAVLEGRADVGTVRSGILEKMSARGELDINSIQILEEKTSHDFPQRRSVALFPEWPFSKLPRTDIGLAKKVAVSLFEMQASDPAAQQSAGAGWTIPLNYSSIHDVLKRLRVEPYQQQALGLGGFIEAYRMWIVSFSMLLIVLVLMLGYLLRTNQKLQQAQQALHDHQGQLEEIVQQRTDELLQTNQTLQIEISSHGEVEQLMNVGTDTLQSIHSVLQRQDLDREQQLNSIIDVLRLHLGMEWGQLSVCNQADKTLQPTLGQQRGQLLDTELAQQALNDQITLVRENTSSWKRYVALPVLLDNEVFCVLEFASSDSFAEHQQHQGYDSELSLNILHLVAQWLAEDLRQYQQQQHRQHHQKDLIQRFDQLSPREKQVLELLVQGESTKSMARKLDISTKTIDMHRANLLRKTQAKSSTELVQLAVSASVF